MTSIKTNVADLVEVGISAQVAHPELSKGVYKPTKHGENVVPIGMGGIVYNVGIGSNAFRPGGDHIEPAVSIRNPDIEVDQALHYYGCIGNEVVLIDGPAAGKKGTITGEHARLIVHFDEDILQSMNGMDQVVVKTVGRGLTINGYEGVVTKKIAPQILKRWDISVGSDGTLDVPVVAEIPSYIMGSGYELAPDFVDQDMMTPDWEELKALGLQDLKLGDIVAVADSDHRFSRRYLEGAVTIALIMHGDSSWLGHGPGCQELMSCVNGEIRPVVDPNCNIGGLLGL